MIRQIEFTLPQFRRGAHLITSFIMNQITPLPEQGLLHIFIKHTSAGLGINENADPSVRKDIETIFNEMFPENAPYLTHTIEGPDDMPAHAKAIVTGSSVSIPISNGRLNLGTWQGIFLFEFRNNGGARKLVATLVY
jgi:secondary thiamine-phosphate synthase enzyme